MTAVNFKEISAYRNAWDLSSICSADRRRMWEGLTDIGASALGERCFVTISNSSDCILLHSCHGGDDRFGTYLFDVMNMFPHTPDELTRRRCLLPGYHSGVIQKMLSKAQSQVFDGFISFSLQSELSGLKYTVSCCWNEWHHTGGLCGTKAGIVIRCENDSTKGNYPDGAVACVIDECTSMYIGDGIALQDIDKKSDDFKVICTFRRSCFHFDICPLAPVSAELCQGFRTMDLQMPISLGDVVVRQLENLSVQLPDTTFCCVCIDNNLSVALNEPSLRSIQGYFFTPEAAIKELPPSKRVGFLYTGPRGGEPLCSGGVQFRVHYLRDVYVVCCGWYVDKKTEQYSAGLEIRIMPKLLDSRERIIKNGIGESGEFVDEAVFVQSVRPPPKCHVFLAPLSSSIVAQKNVKMQLSPWKDSLTEPTKVTLERLEATVMFTKEQFRFTFSDPGCGRLLSSQN